MAGNPEYQNLDPMAVPSPITPQASPADPAGYAMVTPHGQGTSWYDIQAPTDEAAFASQYQAAGVAGAGIVYPVGPRQAATEALLYSPQGAGAMDITSGYAGAGGGSWPADPSPPDDAYNQYTPGNTPGSPTGVDQGTGTD